ncbi:peptidase S8/S53 domain-containing protein [Mycena maculata]|uniref:Peptidase S8/S53 domain-containing protein n=1 Tax=Mycena maculata TaxID=230809 RepID=A0AAD7IAT3_9AGAR|nr:peptidase S8/S53 domain-containing protein [Mycena maculata]
MRVVLSIYLLASLCLRGFSFPVKIGHLERNTRRLTVHIAIPVSTIAPVPNQIPDNYIVQFDTTADMAAHIKQLQSFINGYKSCSKLNNTITEQTNEDFIKYYVGTFDGRALQFISASKGVVGVERSAIIELDLVTDDTNDTGEADDSQAVTNSTLSRRSRNGAPWNLQRITQNGPVTEGSRSLKPPFKKPNSATTLDWTYNLKDSADGQGVVVYVLDTGVQANHPELSPRVLSVASPYIIPGVGGTQVASVVVGETAGVIDGAQIVPIKVQTVKTVKSGKPKPGDMTSATVLDGITAATNHYIQQRGGRGPAVINISVDLEKNGILEDAVEATTGYSKGYSCCNWSVILSFFRITQLDEASEAAGNKGKNMCNDMLKDVGQITVGSTNIKDKKSSFSNFGECVDVYGPGSSILAAKLSSNKLEAVDGTSFAAPHVAGMIAAILSTGVRMTPAQMKAKIISDARGTVVDMSKYPNSNNRLFMFDPSMRSATQSSDSDSA